VASEAADRVFHEDQSARLPNGRWSDSLDIRGIPVFAKASKHIEVSKEASLGLGEIDRINIFRVGALHGTISEQCHTETNNDSNQIRWIAGGFRLETMDKL
jgi:hypothetical protein